MATVQERPPTWPRASSTTTLAPACLSRNAAASPAKPAPTTQTSAVRLLVVLGAALAALPPARIAEPAPPMTCRRENFDMTTSFGSEKFYEAQENRMRSDEDRPHHGQHRRAGDEKHRTLAEMIAGDMDRRVQEAQHDENPGQHHEQKIGLLGDPGQDREHVEQQRQFQLVMERIGDLGNVRRPVRLAQCDVARLAPRRARTACTRRYAAQNASTNVRSTRTNSGSKTVWMDMISPPRGGTLAARQMKINKRISAPRPRTRSARRGRPTP